MALPAASVSEGIALVFDDAAWRGMLELGWSRGRFSEEVGGLAFGFAATRHCSRSWGAT
ncbi:hypothetical protein SSTU70S_00693 [Stutzerimonas stutzeri]